MTGYTYGGTHGAMSLAVRNRIARLEASLRHRDHQVTVLTARLDRRRRDEASRAPAYRDTLTVEELNARPILRHGDTSAVCAERLAAVNAEADEHARNNMRAAAHRRRETRAA